MLHIPFTCFFFWLWVNHFCFFCVCIWCLLTTQFSLVILGQISVSYSDTWCRKLEFCVTSFWFHYHRLWWSSWHAILALFLLYVFLVWNFSWRDLFQVTRIDASCVFYIICSQFIPFEQVTPYFAYYAWFVALLESPYAVLLRTYHYLFLAQVYSSVYIRIQFGLHWSKQSWHSGQWSCHFIDGCQ